MIVDRDEIDAHRVAPKLWVGSSPPYELAHRGVDLVVLAAREDQERRDVPTIHVPLYDEEEPMSRIHFGMALDAAEQIARHRWDDKRVLVTCMAGVNRSAFVTALSMIHTGWTAQGAIETIRDKRRPPIGMEPLSNRTFVSILRDYGRRHRVAFRSRA